MSIPVESRAPSEAPLRVQASSCFHCTLPVPEGHAWQEDVDGTPREFCCAGCLAISRTIGAAGLQRFYAKRKAVVPAPTTSPGDPWTGSDADALEAGWLTADGKGRLEGQLLVDGMSCGACVWLIESWLGRTGDIDVEVNFAQRRARVSWREGTTTLAAIVRELAAIGYRADPYDPARREALARRESRAMLQRMAIAVLAMMQVMMFALPTYVTIDGIAPEHRALLDWASLVLTLPAIGYCAAPIFRSAWRDLRMRHLGMDVPVALGLAAAFAASAWSTLGAGGPVYYDSVTMFIALLLVARHAELKARQRAGSAIERVARQRTSFAERLVEWPASTRTATTMSRTLSAGEHVLVRPGAVIPADGVVVQGRSHVEEAILTGESRPLNKSPGDTLLESSVNREGPLVMRVSAAGGATRLAALLRMADRAFSQRPQLARAAERAARVFVGALLALVAVSALAWWYVEPSRVLPITFALLVVSCPCALSLATPATFAAALGHLASRHVVVARVDALESLARVTHVVFDKTGTLTLGRLRVIEAWASSGCDAPTGLAVASALEARSEHPIASALRQASGNTIAIATDLHHVAGKGIDGVVDGVRYRLGRADFVAELAGAMPAAGRAFVDAMAPWASLVVLGTHETTLAAYAIGDQVRADAAEAIDMLQWQGVTPMLMSGDRVEAAGAIARRLGIADARGAMTPDDKLKAIRSLQEQGAVVAMVGDGINDAPALAQAQVSFSLASATPLAQWSADIVVLGDALTRIPDTVAHARFTLKLVRQNLGWALAYNLLAIPAAAFGFVTPLAAAAGMSLSSLIVVLNALRAGHRDSREAVVAVPVPTSVTA